MTIEHAEKPLLETLEGFWKCARYPAGATR